MFNSSEQRTFATSALSELYFSLLPRVKVTHTIVTQFVADFKNCRLHRQREYINCCFYLGFMLDFKTASTIATSIVHSKLDYRNSLFLNLDFHPNTASAAYPNSLARAVTKRPGIIISLLFSKHFTG